MDEHGSVTIWLSKLKEGETDEATHQLWNRYFSRLVGQARHHLGSRHRAIADEEDLALSAFDSFIRATEAGRFPRLDNRNDLWQILLMLTSRKAVDQLQSQNALKRGGGKVVNFSTLQTADGSGADPDPAGLDPDPVESAAMAEGLEEMLAVLESPDLARVAVLSMEGYKNTEIAGKMGVALSTVERKLKTIRAIYTVAGYWTHPQSS